MKKDLFGWLFSNKQQPTNQPTNNNKREVSFPKNDRATMSGGGTACGGPGSRRTCFDVVDEFAPNERMARRGAAVITGATDGIGVASLEALLRAGYDRVFHLCRNLEKAELAADRLRRRLSERVVDERLVLVRCVLDDLQSVRDAAIAVDAQAGRAGVALLLCNAGVMMTPHRATRQGFELQFGVNHVAHSVLADCLLPALRRAGTPAQPARVVVVSSVMHQSAASTPHGFRSDLLLHEPGQRYDRAVAYGQSKLANVLMALELDARCKERGWPIVCCSLMPGIIATGLFDHIPCGCCCVFMARPCLKSVPQGAATSLWCALAPDVLEMRGGYFEDCGPARASEKGRSLANAKLLASETRRLVEERFGNAKLPHRTERRRVKRKKQSG